MGGALASGWRVALQRWPVVLLLFLANLTFGVAFTAASWSWLSVALDKSLATRTLLTNLDLNVFVDLFVHHRESLRVFMLSGVVLAVFSGLLGVWLNAVAVVAVGEDSGLADCTSRGLRLYAKFVRLWALASVPHAAGIASVCLIGRGLVRWAAESPLEMTVYWVGAASVTAGALILLFFATVHDHARIQMVATGTGALRAYVWALGFVAAREWRALPLAAALLAAGGALWVIYQTVGMLIATTAGPGIALSLILGEMLMLARMLLRVWLLAAETDLQNVVEDGGP